MGYRVWYHNARKSDEYESFKSRTEAEKAARRSPSAEKVVYKIQGRGLKQKEIPLELRKKSFVQKPKKKSLWDIPIYGKMKK